MATKKRRSRKTTGRRRPMSEPAKKRVRRARGKRRGLSSKIGLSEAFNPATVTATGKGMLAGAIVGYGVASLNPMIETMPKWGQHATLLGGSFIAGAVLKMPNVSNSLATIWGFKLAQDMQGLNDDADWADENSLDEEDEYMDEEGNPMFLADDGNFYYLEEENDEDEMLEETNYLAGGLPYPAYANVSDY